jgi:hypothetical protein
VCKKGNSVNIIKLEFYFILIFNKFIASYLYRKHNGEHEILHKFYIARAQSFSDYTLEYPYITCAAGLIPSCATLGA